MSAVIEKSISARTASPVSNGQTVKQRRITVKEYDAMIENGIFDENNHIELLDGIITEKMPKGTKHATLNDIIATRLIQKLNDKLCVKNQNPIWLDEFSEPEPDIVLAKLPLEKYFDNHPTPDDIFLILEIADSTLSYDRETKGAVYARAGIRQYLLLNVQEQTVEDYREPSANGYESKQTRRAGESFNLAAFPDVVLQVADFLPAEKD